MEWLSENFLYIVGVFAIYAVWWFLGWLLERSQKGALKMNKKYLNRKARHTADLPNGNAYRKLAKDRAYDYVT